MPAAAEYPDRPITLVIPLGAGGSHDLHARGITGIISDIIGQPMVVKLVPGASGMKGTGEVAKAKVLANTLIGREAPGEVEKGATRRILKALRGVSFAKARGTTEITLPLLFR